MTIDPPQAGASPERSAWADEAGCLLRQALTATLATLDRDDGTPYGSLVALATLHDATPIVLLSRLALHTRNVTADARASLLVDRRDGGGDALAAPRVTVLGSLLPVTDPVVRGRYLARHPAAVAYADFGDFAFYTLSVARGHFVGGFGRIAPLTADELTASVDDAAALVAAEPSILAHMNEAHADAVDLLARVLGQGGDGPWRLTGVDPVGFDLRAGERTVRLGFPERVASADEVRRAFVVLIAAARSAVQVG